MGTAEDTRQPFISRIERERTSSMKHMEPLDVSMLTGGRTMTMSSNFSNDDKKVTIKRNGRKSADNFSLSDISRRLALRKELHMKLYVLHGFVY